MQPSTILRLGRSLAKTTNRPELSGRIVSDISSEEWDAALAELGGHPLQSALWGDARRTAEGFADLRLMLKLDAKPVYMMRVEQRSVPLLGKVGWAPRGPTGSFPHAHEMISGALKSEGVGLLVTDRWEEVRDAPAEAYRPRTEWIDLSLGREGVWNAFESSFRQGVRRSEKSGVEVSLSDGMPDLDRFFAICRQLSETKGFTLPSTLPLMRALLAKGANGSVEAQLLLARLKGEIAGGVFLIRCGRSLHFFWGGSDRRFSKDRVSEALHWHAIQWALQSGCSRYDLEGLDKARNAGTYVFKKKMGGREVALRGKEYFPFRSWGHFVAAWDRRRRLKVW
jgi:hypothetical protein